MPMLLRPLAVAISRKFDETLEALRCTCSPHGCTSRVFLRNSARANRMKHPMVGCDDTPFFQEPFTICFVGSRSLHRIIRGRNLASFLRVQVHPTRWCDLLKTF
jgi:hypothetical protein